MTAEAAFLLATRHGGLALRRDDLSVISEGAKADLVISVRRLRMWQVLLMRLGLS
jgi:cytosine/adenosine deaminase-related metal-dependent hydrolase